MVEWDPGGGGVGSRQWWGGLFKRWGGRFRGGGDGGVEVVGMGSSGGGLGVGSREC